MSLYKNVLRRLLIEAGQPDLGNIQFSPNRTDGASKEEPNTKDEDRIYRALRGWISSSTIDPDVVEKLYQLIQSKNIVHFFMSLQREQKFIVALKSQRKFWQIGLVNQSIK